MSPAAPAPYGLPFTVEQFYELFVQYNDGVWPMQVVLYAMAVAILMLLLRAGRAESRIVAGLLAVLWAWMAIAYYFLFFTRISGAGWIIGAVLLAGGLWLGWVGGIRGQIQFGPRRDRQGSLGGLLVFYALVAYPLIGFAIGHRYPAMPTFGLPCPVTIFTVGLLLLTTAPVPRSAFLAPALWGVFGGASATFLLGVYQDAGLLLAGIVSVVAMLAPAEPVAAPRPIPRRRRRQAGRPLTGVNARGVV
jgi:hypothetical protein